MADLQNYFQEIVTCTATLTFRVQIIQKVGSSTEIKVRLNVQRRPTLDEPENIKFMNKNAKIYSVPGLKTKTFYKRMLPETPNTKSCKVAFLPPPPPLQCWETFWGNRQCSYKCGSLFIPLRKHPVAKLFIIEMGWRGVVDTTSGRKLPCVAAAPCCNFPRPPPAPS